MYPGQGWSRHLGTWRKVLVVSKRISAVVVMLTLVSIPAVFADGQLERNAKVAAEGVVVAVQLEPGAARSPIYMNSESLGDFAEVWMVRVNRWLHGESAKYILVEYTHVNRHEPYVTDTELNRIVWKFNLDSVPENRRGTCTSWGERFVPTAFGRDEKLPAPKALACFQMQQRAHSR